MNRPSDAKSGYWFRLPDDEAGLMSMRPAEFKCYVVVLRAVQRDRNAGKISTRQVGKRAGISFQHAHEALSSLSGAGWLRTTCEPGKTAVYSLPHSWNTLHCSPTGEHPDQQNNVNYSPRGEQSDAGCSPTGEQHCSPTGEQHLESSEKEKTSSPAFADDGLFASPEKGNESQPCADATRNAPGNGKPRASAASLDAAQERWFEEEFWPHCWRRVDKADAKKAFKKHATDEARKNRIVAACKAHALVYLVRSPEHRPHAATWLNKLRYEEAPEDARPGALNGRYAVPMPAMSAIPDAGDYLRRIANE